MKKNKKLNNKGFSLVELIIVIAIMAVLVGVLAPQFTKYVGQAETSADESNIELLRTTASAVLADTTCDYDETAEKTFTINGSSTTIENTIGNFGTLMLDAIGEWPTSQSVSGGFNLKIKPATGGGYTVTVELVGATPTATP